MGISKRAYKPVEIPKKEFVMKIGKKTESQVESEGKEGLFDQMPAIRTAKERMVDARSQPSIDKLLSVVWQSNELHVLFADTGVGKSILAVALSVALCNGESFLGLENETKSQTVLFYDFELSDRQFRKRYSNDSEVEEELPSSFFIDTFDFAPIIEAAEGYNEKFNELVFDKFKHDVVRTNATVLVLDNITYLNSQTTQDTKTAMDVMRRLNELKKEYNLSILVLAHTPKRGTGPMTLNDLAGSKHLSNFSDSISALGKSAFDKNIRYLKQVKASRSGEMELDSNNVLVCETVKKDTFLTLEFVEFGKESDYLGEANFEERIPDKLHQVTILLKQKNSYSEIANQLNISKGTITKWKNRYPEAFENAIIASNVSNVSSVSNVNEQETVETGNDEGLPF